MGLLQDIVQHKKAEVASRKELYPIKLLEQSLFFGTPCVSLKKYLSREDLPGIIAEIKRRSPSRGVLKSGISVEELSIGYMQAGASALSVLTDKNYFDGSNEDLSTARKYNFCPILRKDFVVDEYQIFEAKSIGADVILLIAAILDAASVKRFSELARALGLEVLLEVHQASELQMLCDSVDIVGVNNRDLDTLNVDVARSHELSQSIPTSVTKISESGISSAATIAALKQQGYRGFLIGEAFMQSAAPARACAQLVQELRQKARA